MGAGTAFEAQPPSGKQHALRRPQLYLFAGYAKTPILLHLGSYVDCSKRGAQLRSSEIDFDACQPLVDCSLSTRSRETLL